MAGINMGLNAVRCTSLSTSTLQFRSEIGIGTYFFRLVYGYNFTLMNKDCEGINKYNVGMNIILNSKTIKHINKKIEKK